MKNNLIKWSFALLLGALLASCEPTPAPEPPAKEGNLSEMTATRNEFFKMQPVFFVCDYTPSTDALADQTRCNVEILKDGEPCSFPSLVPPTAKIQNGQLYTYIRNMYAGNYKITLSVTEKNKKAQTKTFSKSKEFVVSDNQPNIRNSQWFSPKGVCQQDIQYYFYDDINKSDPKLWRFSEDEIYYYKYSNLTEGSFTLEGDREVGYQFNDKDLLERVIYLLFQETPDSKTLVGFMQAHERFLAKPYYGFTEFTNRVDKAPDAIFTEEEQKWISDFENRLIKADSPDGILARLVQEGKIQLFTTSSNASTGTAMEMKMYRNKKGDVPFLAIIFSPIQK